MTFRQPGLEIIFPSGLTGVERVDRILEVAAALPNVLRGKPVLPQTDILPAYNAGAPSGTHEGWLLHEVSRTEPRPVTDHARQHSGLTYVYRAHALHLSLDGDLVASMLTRAGDTNEELVSSGILGRADFDLYDDVSFRSQDIGSFGQAEVFRPDRVVPMLGTFIYAANVVGPLSQHLG